jgi:signal transduction histidine kinase/phage shock protein PspC (stress-responsive transcriptional regulator)
MGIASLRRHDPPVPRHRPHAAPFRRSPDRLLGGVCAGVAERLGIDPLLVRLAAVVLTLGTGIGLGVYMTAWWLAPLDDRPPREDRRPPPSWLAALQRDDTRTLVGAAFLGVGLIILLRVVGALANDVVTIAATLVAAGIAVAWVRTSPEERDRLRDAAARAPGSPLELLRAGPGSIARLALGALLVLGGAFALLAAADAVDDAGSILLAVAVTVGGLALLLGPWVVGLLDVAGEERRARIRSEARADIAAELHDSVLQTLALIQRSAPSRPTEAVALARRQERELRSWLYGDGRALRASGDAETLAAALEAMAAEVEADHGVEVEVVAVGDHPLDQRTAALVAAAREAIVNAARHAGVSTVDCYAEVAGGTAGVYVRDRGRGFDPDDLPTDRHGIAESIRGRMSRVGGQVTITSSPGAGTEVALEVDVEPAR